MSSTVWGWWEYFSYVTIFKWISHNLPGTSKGSGLVFFLFFVIFMDFLLFNALYPYWAERQDILSFSWGKLASVINYLVGNVSKNGMNCWLKDRFFQSNTFPMRRDFSKFSQVRICFTWEGWRGAESNKICLGYSQFDRILKITYSWIYRYHSYKWFYQDTVKKLSPNSYGM